MFFLSEKTDPNMTFFDFIPNPKQMFVFFVLFGITYPLVSFVKRNAMLTRSFSEERINIINIFSTVGYELVSEDRGILVFRLKNKLSGFMRLFYEDMIEVEYNEGSVILSGMKKDVYRIARHIEYLNKNESV